MKKKSHTESPGSTYSLSFVTLQVNIVSVSSDGEVKLWDVVKNEMESKNILVLFDKSLEKESDDQNVPPKACGTCLEFHPINSYMFLVGTEEGKIYKCSTSYSSQVKSTV